LLGIGGSRLADPLAGSLRLRATIGRTDRREIACPKDSPQGGAQRRQTFTDIESFEGTCYKAAGWEPCGLTKGFQRHRADFYREHKRPKKLWLKTLSRNTRVILTGMDVPKAYEAGVEPQSAERALPLKKEQIESLREALSKVEDPRRENRTWPLSTLLTLVCMGLLAGRKNVAEIHRFGQFLNQQQRQWLGFLPKRGGIAGRRAPSD
jgi:hypothetical protein